MTLLEAMEDPKLFAPWFKDRATWAAWRVFLAALFAMPMTGADLAVYQAHTGRQAAPEAAFAEAWLVIGRRGGKSFIMALVAVFLACFRSYRQHLQPGERATVMVIAADRRQARVIMRYIRALLTKVPMLARMIERETAEAFDLDNQVTIEVGTASFRTTRGYTYAAVLADEIAFWRTDDSAEPDYAILGAIRPGMATIPGAMLLCASSPYARRGALWDAHKRYWAQDGAPLVWRATTQEMNPTVPDHVVAEALERDPASAAAEYLAEFRSDVEALLTREAVDAVVIPGRFELPPRSGVRYFAWVDPSGGSADSMTLAIGHAEGKTGVLDAVRERRPPFSPDAVVREFAELLRAYGIATVTGDRYAGEWPRERFRAHGIRYDLAEKPASDLFGELLPLINGGRVEILDHARLNSQLIALERRTTRGGRDIVGHPPGGHDDIANAVAGALSLATGGPTALVISDAFLKRSAMPSRFNAQTAPAGIGGGHW